MLFTVKPDAELGTDDEPGVRVMATAEPDDAELGAVPVTDVVMLEVWPIPKMVPLQLQFTLTGAAFAGAAIQKTVATATGARTPARTREDMDLMTDSRNVEQRCDRIPDRNTEFLNIASSHLSMAEITQSNREEDIIICN
jgi:hypothetical protein